MHIDQNSDTRHNGIGAFVKLRISVVVVVAVAVCRLQRRRVSAHAVADGKQELESRIRPVVELGQIATAIT